MNDDVMTFRLPRETKRELERAAATDRRRPAELARLAVDEYLARRRQSTRRRGGAGEKGA